MGVRAYNPFKWSYSSPTFAAILWYLSDGLEVGEPVLFLCRKYTNHQIETNIIYLPILCDLFGMVKCPFYRLSDIYI